MAKYRVLAPAYINDQLKVEGDIVDVVIEGEVGAHLELIKDTKEEKAAAKLAAAEAAAAEAEAARLAAEAA